MRAGIANRWNSWRPIFNAARLYLIDLGGILWLCLLPVCAVVLLFVLLTGLSQGIEIAQAITRERGPLEKLGTFLSYCYFVLALTFSASAATEDHRDPSINSRFVPWWTLAAALLTAILVLEPGKISLGWAIAMISLLFVVPLAGLVIRGAPGGILPSLYPRHWAGLCEGVFFGTGIILCVLVVVDSVDLPRQMNSVGVVLAGLGFWTFFFTMMLVTWPRRLGLPALTLVGIVVVLLFATANDNHDFHGCERFAFAGLHGATLPTYKCTGGWHQTWATQSQQTFDDHVKTWLHANCRSAKQHDPRPCPMIFVAAQGGGARAAYWTALVLQQLNTKSHGEFGKHLFAVSGISGGTLGSIAFIGSLSHPEASPDTLEDFVGDDFLSPILAALIFPETVQRMWPWPIDAFDRSHAFERSLEYSWKKQFGADDFSRDFMGFWSPEREKTGPAIFMNSTNVESGIPFVISNLDLPIAYHERSYYAFDVDRLYGITSLPMSAAVHLSARFSYVNPPATLYGRISPAALATRKGCSDPTSACAHEIVPWGRLVDGGYYDGSGADTMLDVLLAAKRAVDGWTAQDAVQPEYLVLVITNGADVAYDPDPQFDAELVPERPREPAQQYLIPYKNSKGRGEWTDGGTQIASGTIWSRHIGESDLTSPPQAFFMVGGNHALNDQWTLATTAGQFALATAEKCYGYKASSPIVLDRLLACVPHLPSNEEPRLGNGCPSGSNASIGSAGLQQIAAVIANPEAALSCRTFVNYQKLSFAQAELRTHELDPSGQFARPALGWTLSWESHEALKRAIAYAFSEDTGRSKLHYLAITDALAYYSQPHPSLRTAPAALVTAAIPAAVLRKRLQICAPRVPRRTVPASTVELYRLRSGDFCTPHH